MTDGFLPVLGVAPVPGRVFTRRRRLAERARSGDADVGLLAAEVRRRARVVGQTLTVRWQAARKSSACCRGRSRSSNRSADPACRSSSIGPRSFVGNFSYQAVARLKPGITVEQANADVARMLPLIPEAFPLPPGFTRADVRRLEARPNVRPLSDDVIGDVGRAALDAARHGRHGAAHRVRQRREPVPRSAPRRDSRSLRCATALGAEPRPDRAGRCSRRASCWRSPAGRSASCSRARASRLLVWLAPDGLPRLDEIGINGVVLLFTLGVSLVAGPAVRRSSRCCASASRASRRAQGRRPLGERRPRHATARATCSSSPRSRWRVVLLVGSGLMVRSFQAMRAVNPGFTNPEEVLTLRIAVPEALVADTDAGRAHAPADRRGRRARARRDLGRPDVVAHDGRYDSNDPIFAEGIHARRRTRCRRSAGYKWVGPATSRRWATALVAGRHADLAPTASNATPVVSSTRALAREYCEVADRGARPSHPQLAQQPLARDRRRRRRRARRRGWRSPATPMVYWPLLMNDFWRRRCSRSATLAYVDPDPTAMGSPTLHARKSSRRCGR